jgi:hypothetical protein
MFSAMAVTVMYSVLLWVMLLRDDPALYVTAYFPVVLWVFYDIFGRER